MAYKESRNGGIGTIVGFLCGVGVGLLFATRPGSETRRRIVDLFNKGRERGEGLIEKGREQVGQTAGGAGSQAKEPFYESGKYT